MFDDKDADTTNASITVEPDYEMSLKSFQKQKLIQKEYLDELKQLSKKYPQEDLGPLYEEHALDKIAMAVANAVSMSESLEEKEKKLEPGEWVKVRALTLVNGLGADFFFDHADHLLF